MENVLETQASHPYIHSENLFVCLWNRCRISNSVEHAVYKPAATLSGNFQNPGALPVMQPEACDYANRDAGPLPGVWHSPGSTAYAGKHRQHLL